MRTPIQPPFLRRLAGAKLKRWPERSPETSAAIKRINQRRRQRQLVALLVGWNMAGRVV